MAERESARDPKEMVKAMFVVTNEIQDALRKEAFDRALATGGRPDASAVLREVVEAWIAKSGKR